MNNFHHIINKEIIELTVDDKESAAVIERMVNVLLVNGLQKEMEILFDKICKSEEHLLIDKIEIDLGVLNCTDFKNEFTSHLLTELKKKISDSYNTAKRQLHYVPDETNKLINADDVNSDHYVSEKKRVKKKDEVVSESNYIISILIYFLEYGVFPTWAPEISLYDLEIQIKEKIYSINAAQLLSEIKKNETRIARFINQFRDDFILTIVFFQSPAQIEFIEKSLERLLLLIEEMFYPVLSVQEIKHRFLREFFYLDQPMYNESVMSSALEKLLPVISEKINLLSEEILYALKISVLAEEFNESRFPTDNLLKIILAIPQRNAKTVIPKSRFIENIILSKFLRNKKSVTTEEVIQRIRKKSEYFPARLFDTLIKIIQLTEKKHRVISDSYMQRMIEGWKLDLLHEIDEKYKNNELTLEIIKKEFIQLLLLVRNILPGKKDFDIIIQPLIEEVEKYFGEKGLFNSPVLILNEDIAGVDEINFSKESIDIERIKKYQCRPGMFSDILNNFKNNISPLFNHDSTKIFSENVQDKVLHDSSIEVKTSDKKTEKELSPDEYYITNAGIVILYPFIENLFNKLGYLKDDFFISAEKSTRGIYVLQCCVDKKYLYDEQELILNKVICGVGINYPLPKNIELTEFEVSETDKMITAAISHWSKIKNTSVEGFKESFILRDGKLTDEENCWKLLVERKSFDILLDSIPWTFSSIKLPWMIKPIKVEW